MKIKSISSLVLLASTVASLTLGTVAHAEESLFGYVYGAETLPKGETEFATYLTHRRDKGMGKYTANDTQAEVAYGITDRLTGSAYLKFMNINSQGAFPTSVNTGEVLYPDNKGNYFSGVKANLKYNILSPYLDNGWGLAVMVEPAYLTRFKVDGAKTKQMEIEGSVIVQKNLMDDQLVLAWNTTLSAERRVLLEADNFVEYEREMTNTFGASYRVAPKWYLGVEGRHHMDVLKDPEDGVYRKNQYSMYVGPTLHYADKKWSITGTLLKQVRGGPTYGKSVGPVVGGVRSRLHLDENEKYEARIKVTYEFK